MSCVRTYAQQVGLVIGQKKTEVMMLNVTDRPLFTTTGYDLPMSRGFAHLVSPVRHVGWINRHVKNCLGKARSYHPSRAPTPNQSCTRVVWFAHSVWLKVTSSSSTPRTSEEYCTYFGPIRSSTLNLSPIATEKACGQSGCRRQHTSTTSRCHRTALCWTPDGSCR